MDDSKNRINLSEDIHNTIKYELHLSKPPDEKLVGEYKNHLSRIVSPDFSQIFSLKKHSRFNVFSGSLKFDQNVQEEWLVIYALYELSKVDHDLVIRVHDDDGDILLIEAADHLPNWLESRKSKHRTFIHMGKLHIIPEFIDLKQLSNESGDPKNIPHVAAQFVREVNRSGGKRGSPTGLTSDVSGDDANNIPQTTRHANVKTLADNEVQKAIEDQMSGMPEKEAWLSKKFEQLDKIFSNSESQTAEHVQKRFKESLTLDSILAMREEDLQSSPLSSLSTSQSTSSSHWLTESCEDSDC